MIGASAIAVVLGAWLSGCMTPDDTEVVPFRPGGTAALEGALPADSVYLFQNRDFKGDATRIENVPAMSPATTYDLPRAGSTSSIRWGLSPGLVVVLYERPGGRGDQIPLWGSGQVSSLSQWRSNDKASQWAYYPVAGSAEAQRPLGAMPTSAVAPASIELYKNSDLRGTLTIIGPVTQFSLGQFHKTGGASDQMSSLRWNLPPGVVVMLYEDAEGKGRQLVLFGSGQYMSVSPWNFNDRVSRWAWYDVARP
jgi:hypothetical protein